MKPAIIGIGAIGAIIGWTPMAGAAEGEWYVSGYGGGMWLENSQNSGTGSPLHFSSSYDTGYAFRAAVGAYRAPQVRTELELGYRTVRFDKLSVNNDGGLGAAAGTAPLSGTTVASGRYNAISAMLNAYYDYDTGTAWHPYIDAGIGAARLMFHHVTGAGVQVADAKDLVFAYQFGIGIGYDLTKSLTIAADYRYFTTLDPTFRDAVGANFTSEFTSHNLSLGIRYRF